MQVDICSSFGDIQYGVHTLNGLSTSSMQNLNFGKYENTLRLIHWLYMEINVKSFYLSGHMAYGGLAEKNELEMVCFIK